MKHNVLEMYRQRFEALAAQMEEETMACSTAMIQLGGRDYEVPATVVRGSADSRLERPVVRSQVLGIETSECPVVAVGIEFPRQVGALSGWYWSWIPMHTAEQRKLAALMARSPCWLVLIFSGSVVSRAVVVGVSDFARARYRQLELVVRSYPTDPKADTGRAIAAAQAATAAVLGDGFELQIVKDIRREDLP